MKWSRARVIIISAASGFVLLAAGTVAGAAIAVPIDGSGVIYGCYTTKANATASHMLVLQDVGTACPPNETAIKWNQTGPQGPAGPAGPAGQAGPAGPTGPAVSSLDSLNGAPCNNGQGSTQVSYGTGDSVTIQCVPLFPPKTFPAGNQPGAIAFDGTHLWVANQTGDLTVLNTDGSTAFSAGAGGVTRPSAIAVDSAHHVWVTDAQFNDVTEFNPDGSIVGTFPVGTTPDGITYDGTHMWVANLNSSNVTELNPDGSVAGTFPVVAGGPAGSGTGPNAIAFDGTRIWVAVAATGTLNVLNTDGSSAFLAFASQPSAIAVDSTGHVWVADAQLNAALEFDPANGNEIGSTSVGTSPQAIAFDGTHMWVANNGSNNVTEINANGSVASTFRAGQAPLGIAFDGAHMWVTNNGSNNVTQLP